MARVVLVHWNEDEGVERCARLRAAGYGVRVYREHGGADGVAREDSLPSSRSLDPGVKDDS